MEANTVNMKIGLPKALLYYKYKRLWEEFFTGLGHEIVTSPETDSRILSDGILYSVDECCLPAKIYMGHIFWLKDKCDYILVPRVENFGKKESVCVKFNALYDIVKNTFDAKLLNYDVDVLNGHGECEGFVKMGAELGSSRLKTFTAYKRAKRLQALSDSDECAKQEELLKTGGLKIMLVSHPYNSHDKIIGFPTADYVKNLGGTVIYADKFSNSLCRETAKVLSPSLYWTYNKELIGAASLYKDYVDGIIFITAFPCGPDSLVTDLMLRRLKNIPVCNIVVDELQGQSGLYTRIESFIDIIEQRKRQNGKNITGEAVL